MNYTCTTEINLPIEKVVALWEDENNFKHWQDGFQSIELMQGTKDQVGAISRIYLQQGKRRMELKETILINELPKEKKAEYEHPHDQYTVLSF